MQKHHSFKRVLAVIIMMVQVGFLATAAITFGQDLRRSNNDRINNRPVVTQGTQENQQNETLYQRARRNFIEFFDLVFGTSDIDESNYEINEPHSVLPLPIVPPPDGGDDGDSNGNG